MGGDRSSVILPRLGRIKPHLSAGTGSKRGFFGPNSLVIRPDGLLLKLLKGPVIFLFSICRSYGLRLLLQVPQVTGYVIFERKESMLRFITILAFLISARAAGAQNPPPFVPPAIPPTDLSSGIGNYCIYESLIYSIGSPLCIGKTSYICAPTTANSGFNQRGYWTARPADPNLLVAPACQ
jgi:hypothetical protein